MFLFYLKRIYIQNIQIINKYISVLENTKLNYETIALRFISQPNVLFYTECAHWYNWRP